MDVRCSSFILPLPRPLFKSEYRISNKEYRISKVRLASLLLLRYSLFLARDDQRSFFRSIFCGLLFAFFSLCHFYPAMTEGHFAGRHFDFGILSSFVIRISSFPIPYSPFPIKTLSLPGMICRLNGMECLGSPGNGPRTCRGDRSPHSGGRPRVSLPGWCEQMCGG